MSHPRKKIEKEFLENRISWKFCEKRLLDSFPIAGTRDYFISLVLLEILKELQFMNNIINSSPKHE